MQKNKNEIMLSQYQSNWKIFENWHRKTYQN